MNMNEPVNIVNTPFRGKLSLQLAFPGFVQCIFLRLFFLTFLLSVGVMEKYERRFLIREYR